MTDAQIAYIAGLFEGEGCIFCGRPGRLRLIITMTDEDVVRALPNLTGMGNVPPKSRRLPSGKQSYTWVVGRCDDAAELLRLILPWLGERRSEAAKRALRDWDEVAKPRRLWTHCSHGHLLSGRNLRISEGRRRCRACINERARKYRRMAA
jgi:hypothetical protein